MSVVDRTPPHDFDAEQAILGSIMMIDGSYRTLSETLRVEHFADPLHGRIFEAAGAGSDVTRAGRRRLSSILFS